MMANSTVMATEVESRILDEQRQPGETQAHHCGAPGYVALVRIGRIGLAVLVQVRRRNESGLGNGNQRQREAAAPAR